MPGLLEPAAFERVFSAWRRALRHDPLLSRTPMPELRPFAEAFNNEMVGEDEGALATACDNLVRQKLEANTVIRITTILAETFADEVGHASGATTKSLVATLGHVCALLATTMVADEAEVARRDSLTGLENRLAWTETVNSIIASGESGAIAMIDLDGLKAVNDGDGGHEAGDAMLKGFARDLNDAVRESGRAYRFGGDEYAVLCPKRTSIELDELLAGLAAVPTTSVFSFGTCEFPSEGTQLESLTKLADERMYEMKRHHKEGH